MEHLTPSLSLIFNCKKAIEQGESLRPELERFLKTEVGPLSLAVKVLLAMDLKDEQQVMKLKKSGPWINLSPLQRALILTCARGLQGQGIYSQLQELELEANSTLTIEMDKFVRLLPLRLLVPLLFFIFPSFALLFYAAFASSFAQLGG